MPDTRTQRGPHPRDRRLFAESELPKLSAAIDDHGYLLGRGYNPKSALELVGNRYQLALRQRSVVQRCSASAEAIARRQANRVKASEMAGRELWIDGYNVLLTIEAALSGGLVLAARDGSYRDLAALSAHYRRVDTTTPAIEAIGGRLAQLEVGPVRWLLDRPISNSARLRQLILDAAGAHRWDWQARLESNTDSCLVESGHRVATADSGILDAASSDGQPVRCLNLAALVVESLIAGSPEAEGIDCWLLRL